MDEQGSIFERIVRRCEEIGISPSTMCDNINCRRGILTELRKNPKRGLSSENSIKIAKKLNISIDYLLTGKEFFPSLTEEEDNLLHAYRRATQEEKENIAFLLRRYMQEEKSEEKAG